MNAIYYAPPYIKNGRIFSEHVINLGRNKIKVDVPIGKLIFESAVEFGKIGIQWEGNDIEIKCDNVGKSLENWINKKLQIKGISKLIGEYDGKIPLEKILPIKNLPGLRG